MEPGFRVGTLHRENRWERVKYKRKSKRQVKGGRVEKRGQKGLVCEYSEFPCVSGEVGVLIRGTVSTSLTPPFTPFQQDFHTGEEWDQRGGGLSRLGVGVGSLLSGTRKVETVKMGERRELWSRTDAGVPEGAHFRLD